MMIPGTGCRSRSTGVRLVYCSGPRVRTEGLASRGNKEWKQKTHVRDIKTEASEAGWTRVGNEKTESRISPRVWASVAGGTMKSWMEGEERVCAHTATDTNNSKTRRLGGHTQMASAASGRDGPAASLALGGTLLMSHLIQTPA